MLTEHPAWLTVDTESGVVTGVPGPGDAGMFRVTVRCRRTYPRELKRGDYRPSYFLKDHLRFQATHEQTFAVTVKERTRRVVRANAKS